MNIKFSEMGKNEQEKFIRLTYRLITLDWEISDTDSGVNSSNGNVYVYNEFEPYSLFIDLADNLMACKTDYETGEEEFLELKGNESKQELEEWASKPITV